MRLVWFLVIALSLAISACSNARDEKPQDTGISDNGLIGVIKKGSLVDFRSPTIGEAFDAYEYLIDKEWRATPLKSGHVTVDFTGWFRDFELNDIDKKSGVKKKGLEVVFVIEPSGAYYVFMVSVQELMVDGGIRKLQYPDIKGILTKIYANERIVL